MTRSVPTTDEYLLTHSPINPHCEACRRAKLTRKPARRIRRDPEEVPKKFGDLINADHIISQSEEAQGLMGEREALIIVDRYSDYIDCYPVKRKTTEDAYAASSMIWEYTFGLITYGKTPTRRQRSMFLEPKEQARATDATRDTCGDRRTCARRRRCLRATKSKWEYTQHETHVCHLVLELLAHRLR